MKLLIYIDDNKSVTVNFKITKEAIEAMEILSNLLRTAGATTITTDAGNVDISTWLTAMENI